MNPEEINYRGVQGMLVPKAYDAHQLHDSVNAFIDHSPTLSTALENAWATDDMATFEPKMSQLETLLESIHAKSLALDAQKMIRCSGDFKRWALVKQSFKPFMTDVASLSIALQQIQNRDQDASKQVNNSKVELFVNTSKSVSTVGSLLEDGYIEPAKMLLKELIEHHKDVPVFANLLNALTAGKVEDVQNTIKVVLDKFNKTLDELVGVDLNKCVLAVDDMPEILSFVNNAIKDNYKVIPVPSGRAALAALKAHTPDLFILDIEMPEMDGFELAATIRKMPEHAATPIIFLTGNSSRSYITKAMQVGADEFIIKPASHGYLLAKVGGFLNKN